MAEFKAPLPPMFNPFTSDFTNFSEWRDEFNVYVSATAFFAENVNLQIQQARLFNLAGSDLIKFVKQLIAVDATTTINTILEAIENALNRRALISRTVKNFSIARKRRAFLRLNSFRKYVISMFWQDIQMRFQRTF